MPARQRPPSAARDLIPERPDLGALRSAAAACTACDLHRDATRTVFGEGAASSEVMLVGEQPGDGEDRAGRPCARPAGCDRRPGPAGRLVPGQPPAGRASTPTSPPGSWPPSTPPPSSAPPTRRPAPWPTRGSWPTWPWSRRSWVGDGLPGSIALRVGAWRRAMEPEELTELAVAAATQA